VALKKSWNLHREAVCPDNVQRPRQRTKVGDALSFDKFENLDSSLEIKHISRKGPEVGISRIDLIEFFP